MNRLSLVAALSFTACSGEFGESQLDYYQASDGLAGRTADGDAVQVVTFEGDRASNPSTTIGVGDMVPDVAVAGDPGEMGAGWEDDVREDIDQPGAQDGDGPSAADDFFDPEGVCAPAHPDDERGCPVITQDVMGGNALLAEVVTACQQWMSRGPSGYAMVEEERWMEEDGSIVGETFDALVCNGETVDAMRIPDGASIPADSVASVDNLFAMIADMAQDPEFEVSAVFHRDLGYPMVVAFETSIDDKDLYYGHFVKIRPIGPIDDKPAEAEQ
jgi:hypothetical protein